MTSYAAILPGARVRGPDGYIGTVEQLTRQGLPGDGQPDSMVVRSDDRQWRYAIPLLLVTGVSQELLHPVVTVRFAADELPYYIVGPAERTSGRTAASAPTSGDGADLVVPLAVEELTARKRPAQIGSVRVHKGIARSEQRVNVPVYHEEAVIERIAPDQYDGRAPADPSEVIVPVLEERLVVHKETVIAEYIRVRKRLVEDRREFADTLRRETVSVFQTRTDDPAKSGQVQVERPNVSAEEPDATAERA